MATFSQTANQAFNVKPNPLIQSYSPKSESQQVTQASTNAPTPAQVRYNNQPSNTGTVTHLSGGSNTSNAPTPAQVRYNNQPSNESVTPLSNPLIEANKNNQGNTLKNQIENKQSTSSLAFEKYNNPLGNAYKENKKNDVYYNAPSLTNFQKGGTISGMQPNFTDNFYAKPTPPNQTGINLGDIEYGVFSSFQKYSYQPSGAMTEQQKEDILSKGQFKSGGFVWELPILSNIAYTKLSQAERQASNELEYNKQMDALGINLGLAGAVKGQGLISSTTSTTSYETTYNPFEWNAGNIIKGKSPFQKEKTSYSTEYGNIDWERAQSNLAKQNIDLKFDKTITQEETKGGYSYIDTSGIAWEVSPEIKTTTEYSNLGFSSKNLDTNNYSFYMKDLIKAEQEGKSKIPIYAESTIGSFGTATAKGIALAFGAEALGVPALVEYTSVGLLATTGTKIASGIFYGGLVTGSVYNIGKGSTESYYSFKQAGLSGFEGAVSGGVKETASTAGFFIGVSKGELSPIQIQPVAITGGTGESSAYSLGLVNPFGRSGTAIATYTKGEGFNIGSYKPLKYLAVGSDVGIESGNQLGLQVLRQTSKTLSLSEDTKIYSDLFTNVETAAKYSFKVQAQGKSVVDISKNKFFESMGEYKGLQEAFVQRFAQQAKGSGEFTFEGLSNVFKENVMFGAFSSPERAALERGFGSTFTKAEGGITRMANDIDRNFYGKVIARTESDVQFFNKFAPNQFSSKDGQLLFKGEKITESFGIDVPSQNAAPLGFRSQNPKSMKLVTGESISGQKLGESIVQRGSSILTIQKTESGGLIFSPRAGQEKALPDFYKMIGRASELTSGKKSIKLKTLQTEFGSIAKKLNPNIDLESGTIKTGSPLANKVSLGLPSAGYISSKSFSTSSQFKTSSISLKSSSFSSMSKSLSSSISTSSSSISKSISSSLSSSSSSMSKSLSSFPSSSSSSSRSSLSSLSSLSSSSSSKSSKSSSSSSSSSFFKYGGFGLPSIGFQEVGTPKKKKKIKRKKGQILPSFTAQVFNIRGSLPKGGQFGISPFEMRKIPYNKKNFYNTTF